MSGTEEGTLVLNAVSQGRGRGIQVGGAILVVIGIILIILALWPQFDGAAGAGGNAPFRLLAAVAFLLGGVFAVLFGVHLRNAEDAVRTLSKAAGGEEPPAWSDIVAVSRAAAGKLVESRADAARAVRDARRELDLRIEELTEAHDDLATHHRFTKRMLQSLRCEEVYDVLLEGVREGLGYRGAILGLRDSGGDLVFRGEGDLDGRSAVRVPAWDAASLIGRTAWEGNRVLVTTIRDHAHRFEDRLAAGEEAAFLVPVARKKSAVCSDLKGCGNRDCPAFARENAKCWMEPGACSDVPPGERRKACVRCVIFPVSALLVVRGRVDSRPFTRETMRSIGTLADEAALALEIVELYESARRMSVTDGLTGLVNHREFFNIVRRELERARRYQHTVSLLMIDVDDFKKYNDLYGHLAGDVALRRIASVLRNCARATDLVARYGGEEFAVVLPESTPGGALMLAERIKSEVARTDFTAEPPGSVRLTVSIGIFTADGGAVSEDQMVGFADEAAYRAKNSGKNRVVVKAHA